MKFTRLLPILFLILAPVQARQDPTICGTHAERTKEEIYLSRQAAKTRAREAGAGRHSGPPGEARPRAAARDIGNIAVLEDVEGIVARRNIFNLSGRTVLFQPAAPSGSRYRFETGAASYEPALASAGTPVLLGDDDTRETPLPFAFPFFGASYRSVFINSDGNLTFGAGDSASSDRSLGRFTAGPPRIAALFNDLDPTASRDGVRTLSENWRFVVTWSAVPEFDGFVGQTQSFQIRLYPDGRIEMAWAAISLSEDAIAGIAPGNRQGSLELVSFTGGSSADFSAVAERFSLTERIDIAAAAQKFYETHDDSYDYLVVFNNMGIKADDGALAFEVTVRNDRTGFGDRLADAGREFGSARRLQAFLNMGPLTQYPLNPNEPIPGRGQISGDTPLTVLGHEAGHLFLAFASVRDGNNAAPMLGRDGAHWAFEFNSEASLLEGNRIRDDGPGASPRFTTIATVEGYSALDQYLMGFRAAEEVPPTFYVRGAGPFFGGRVPQVGIGINGERRNVAIEELIGQVGRRTPDHTVAQRRFHFAFLLVVPKNSEPTAAQLDQMETYRREFEPYFRRVSGDRATADTSLRRSLYLSVFPAAGVTTGATVDATVSIAAPAESPITVLLSTRTGAAAVPSSVTIPAGATKTVFQVRGIRPGVEELSAEQSGTSYQIASARIQVSNLASDVKLALISGDKQVGASGTPLTQPVVFRVTDINNLPYPGVRVTASVTPGGTLDAVTATSDETGRVEFRWTPANSTLNELRAFIDGAIVSSAVTATVIARPAFEAADVVNSASYAADLTPGSLATIFGTNLAAGSTAVATLPLPERLAGVQVTLNGTPAPLVYVSDRQINFYVPLGLAEGAVDLAVSHPVATAARRVNLRAIAPGIFFDAASGIGAILVAGTGQTTLQRPAAAGDVLEIYATGLGPVTSGSGGLQPTLAQPQVLLGAVPATVTFSGLAPGFVGLYQVNARVPAGAASGTQPVSLVVNGIRSNSVGVRIR